MSTNGRFCDRYPALFGKSGLSFSVGAGWSALLDRLFVQLVDVITRVSNNERRLLPEQIVVQIKQKHGELRIYLSNRLYADLPGLYAQMRLFVDATYAVSRVTCEVCGAHGRERDSVRACVHTKCADHDDDEPAEQVWSHEPPEGY